MNTAIDNIIVVENFGINSITKSTSSTIFPAGKGVNVARTIETLGKEVNILGFVGEDSRSLFEKLSSLTLKVNLTDVKGKTRTNISILDSRKKTETHIQNPGFKITQHDLNKLETSIYNNVSSGDLVAISGSLPSGADSSTYKKIIHICHDLGAQVILDSSNDHFKYGLLEKPYMIKPNIEELEVLVGRNLEEDDDIIKAARDISEMGIELVVVSRGAKGVLVIKRSSGKVWKAYISINEPIISTTQVGSGDALVGGFAVGLIERRTLPETIRLGVACGAANLLSIGPGISILSDIERLLPQVAIEELA